MTWVKYVISTGMMKICTKFLPEFLKGRDHSGDWAEAVGLYYTGYKKTGYEGVDMNHTADSS
jgi:hypothetical protein